MRAAGSSGVKSVLSIDGAGWLAPAYGVVLHPECTHWDERPDPEDVPLVVMHNITLPPYELRTGCVEDFFLGRLDTARDASLAALAGVRVSSHFFISRDGVIHQFVSTGKRAWHAGVSSFQGRDNCNHFSVGIEVEGTDFSPFAESQYRALSALLAALYARHGFRFIVGHSDIAPGRKTDPGPYFDWVRLWQDKEQFGSPDFAGAAARIALSVRNPHRDLA